LLEASGQRTRLGQTLDFDSVYRGHVHQVAAWVSRLGGRDEDVDDLVHEVFVIVHRKLDTFRGDAKLSTWIYRITLRVVQAHRRRARVRRWFGWAREREGALEHVADDAPGPAERLEAQQASELVHRALDGLTENHRAAFVMFELEGMSGEAIAEILNTKPGTVWVWLHRARAHFAERVEKLAGGTRP
jgi:RNA polymerase sigma-70 factor (ECF subfamily)